MNQGEKNIAYHAHKSTFAEALPIGGENHCPTRLMHIPALLPPAAAKPPKPHGLAFLLAPVSSTKITAATTQEYFCFPALPLRRAPPLQRGSICSDAKARGLPSPMQPLARQFQFLQNKWIFQLWVKNQFQLREQQKKKKTNRRNNFSAAGTHAPHQHRSAHKHRSGQSLKGHYSEGCKTLFQDQESHARKNLHSPQCSPPWFIKHHLRCYTNNNAPLGDKLELEQTACQHAAAPLRRLRAACGRRATTTQNQAAC